MRFLIAATHPSVRKYVNPPPANPRVQVLGRPRLGCYNLQTILPRDVFDELMRVENETDVYRTRVAANVLCEWARSQQQLRRSHG